MSRVETLQRIGSRHDLAFADQYGWLMQRLSASQRDGAGSDRRTRDESDERSECKPDRAQPSTDAKRRPRGYLPVGLGSGLPKTRGRSICWPAPPRRFAPPLLG